MYSRRIAKVLSKLQQLLTVREYLEITERFSKVNKFNELSETDQDIIIKQEK